MIVTMITPAHPPCRHFRSSLKQVSHFVADSSCSSGCSDMKDDDDSTDFGYEDTSPVEYGYGPTSTTATTRTTSPLQADSCSDANSLDYGYTSADNAADVYGYGEPSSAETHHPPLTSASHHGKMPRRSSLKSTGVPRRASISYKGEVEVKLPNRRTVRRRVSIGFSDDKNQVKEVEPLHSMQGGIDKQDLWVQRDEEGINKEKAYVVAEYARRFDAETLAKKNLHVRGLERQMNPRGTRKVIKEGKFTVLDEQDYQRSQGIFCDIAIGETYAAAAATSLVKAQAMAQNDYADVKEDHEVIRRMMRRASM